MPGLPRSYRSIEEFEREEIRPGLRIGFNLDDLEEGTFEVGFGLDAEREDDPFDRQGNVPSGKNAYASEPSSGAASRRARRRRSH
jgi:hypothetical protein